MIRLKLIFRALALMMVLALAALYAAGCTPAKFVSAYNSVISKAGEYLVTSELLLRGDRDLGRDKYVGSYTADYDDFSGWECPFGGTSVTREGGYMLDVSCTIDVEEGTAKLMLLSGADDAQVLLEGSGEYSGVLDFSSGGCYLVIDGDGLSGSLSLTVSDAE